MFLRFSEPPGCPEGHLLRGGSWVEPLVTHGTPDFCFPPPPLAGQVTHSGPEKFPPPSFYVILCCVRALFVHFSTRWALFGQFVFPPPPYVGKMCDCLLRFFFSSSSFFPHMSFCIGDPLRTVIL